MSSGIYGFNNRRSQTHPDINTLCAHMSVNLAGFHADLLWPVPASVNESGGFYHTITSSEKFQTIICLCVRVYERWLKGILCPQGKSPSSFLLSLPFSLHQRGTNLLTNRSVPYLSIFPNVVSHPATSFPRVSISLPSLCCSISSFLYLYLPLPLCLIQYQTQHVVINKTCKDTFSLYSCRVQLFVCYLMKTICRYFLQLSFRGEDPVDEM